MIQGLADVTETLRHLVAENVRIRASQGVGLDALDLCRLDFSSTADIVARRLVFYLVYQVTRRTVTEEKSQFKYPADWWQAIKHRWFPRWSLRRWPVVWAEVVLQTIVRFYTCPHLNSAKDGKYFHFAFLASSTEAEARLQELALQVHAIPNSARPDLLTEYAVREWAERTIMTIRNIQQQLEDWGYISAEQAETGSQSW